MRTTIEVGWQFIPAPAGRQAYRSLRDFEELSEFAPEDLVTGPHPVLAMGMRTDRVRALWGENENSRDAVERFDEYADERNRDPGFIVMALMLDVDEFQPWWTLGREAFWTEAEALATAKMRIEIAKREKARKAKGDG